MLIYNNCFPIVFSFIFPKFFRNFIEVFTKLILKKLKNVNKIFIKIPILKHFPLNFRVISGQFY